MYNDISLVDFEGATIIKIENGENALQPAIFLELKQSNEKFIITISNSHKFCIVRINERN